MLLFTLHKEQDLTSEIQKQFAYSAQDNYEGDELTLFFKHNEKFFKATATVCDEMSGMGTYNEKIKEVSKEVLLDKLEQEYTDFKKEYEQKEQWLMANIATQKELIS